MSLGTYALITLADLEEYANITITDHEQLLERLIDAATSLFESFTRRKLKARAYSYDSDSGDYDSDNAVFDGNGTDKMVLPQYPVNSITTLRINETEIDARPSLYNNGYVIDKQNGIITLSGYSYTEGLANIDFAYNAGLSAIPEDLQQACIEQVVWMYKQSTPGGRLLGVSSKSLADGSISYSTKDLLPSVRMVLGSYKSHFGL